MKKYSLLQNQPKITFVCRNPDCTSHLESPAFKHFIRKGSYYRASEAKYISRLRCKLCGTGGSMGTYDPCYRQKKRQLNLDVARRMNDLANERGCARALGIHRRTVARKVAFVAAQARLAFLRLNSSFTGKQAVKEVQFDEMESYEHTKCKPISIPLLVHAQTRLILGIDACRMPAKGRLAEISRNKYGPRPDERIPTIRKLLETASRFIHENAEITTDSHPFYPRLIREILPSATHTRVKGREPRNSGQGELKKGGFDPIFSLNHTAAMLRAHVSRLIRQTWCTNKKIERLRDHLILYALAHNDFILQELAKKAEKSCAKVALT